MPPPAWTGPAVHAFRALEVCERFMDIARRHLAFSLRVTTARDPLRAMHHLPPAARWLQRANEQYTIAADDMNRAVHIMTMAPQQVEGDVAAHALMDIVERLGEISAQLAELSERLEERSKETLADALAAAEEGRPLIGAPVRPIPPRSFFLRPNVGEVLRALLTRRQRSKAAAPEDVPRKRSRGRAPPLRSACPI